MLHARRRRLRIEHALAGIRRGEQAQSDGRVAGSSGASSGQRRDARRRCARSSRAARLGGVGHARNAIAGAPAGVASASPRACAPSPAGRRRRVGRPRLERRGLVDAAAARARRCVEPVREQDLDRAADRDRDERAEDARDLGADEHRDEDRQRRQRDRPPVDERLDEVVLELLVDDREGEHDDARRSASRVKATSVTMIAPSVAPASGIRSSIGDEQPERERVRDAERSAGRSSWRARDEADQQVARHVAADEVVDVVGDRARLRPHPRGQQLDHARSPSAGPRAA